jgi:redox-sensing transcriptional repressor
MARDKVSIAVIRRLPRYYRHLEELSGSGIVRMSSKQLAQRMGLTASQIRQDLNCFGGFGQQGYGYNVEYLKNEIASILGMYKKHRTIIIGVGNMGRALINNFNFDKRGFSLLAGFAVAQDTVGTTIGGVEVHHIDTLEKYIEENKPEVAVLTLPRPAAPEVAARLISSGIRGLWNFTNIDLHVTNSRIKVENVHFSDSLMTLCYRLGEDD